MASCVSPFARHARNATEGGHTKTGFAAPASLTSSMQLPRTDTTRSPTKKVITRDVGKPSLRFEAFSLSLSLSLPSAVVSRARVFSSNVEPALRSSGGVPKAGIWFSWTPKKNRRRAAQLFSSPQSSNFFLSVPPGAYLTVSGCFS